MWNMPGDMSTQNLQHELSFGFLGNGESTHYSLLWLF
jgi:hypothetical protein